MTIIPAPLPVIALVRNEYGSVAEYVVHALEIDGERLHLLAGPHRLPQTHVPAVLWSPVLPLSAEQVQLAGLTVHASRARAVAALRELLRRVRTSALRLEALETLPPLVTDHVDQSLQLPPDPPQPPRLGARIE